MPGPKLDPTDRAIIGELQVEGRMPYSQLAPKVGLSEAATRQRVNRLLDSGVVQVVAVTDPAALGMGFQAMVGVGVDGDVTSVADALADMSQVEYVVITTGRYDILAEVVCADADDLLDVVHQGIRSLPGIRSTEIFGYLRLVKQSYSWGTA